MSHIFFKSQSVPQLTDLSGDALEVSDPQIGKHFTKLPHNDQLVKTTVANFLDLYRPMRSHLLCLSSGSASFEGHGL